MTQEGKAGPGKVDQGVRVLAVKPETHPWAPCGRREMTLTGCLLACTHRQTDT